MSLERILDIKSSTIFNRRRTKNEINNFNNELLTKRNFEKYNFDSAVFFNCKFEDVEFGSLLNVEFSKCIFKNCTFIRKREYTLDKISNFVDLEKVQFYSCKFKSTGFMGLHISGLGIIKCEFENKPSFHSVICTGPLIVDNSGEWDVFEGLSQIHIRTDTGGDLVTDFFEGTTPLVSWGRIRNIQKIPFMNISIFSIAMLVLLITGLSIFSDYITGLEEYCINGKASAENIFSKTILLDCKIDWLHKQISQWASRLALGATASVVLLLSTLIHRLFSPVEISTYTQSQWQDQMRPTDQYLLLSVSNRKMIMLTYALYSLVLIYFLTLVMLNIEIIIEKIQFLFRSTF
ncbi:MAG: hypothetical protein COC24_002155 [Alphaproteobacteria bacterium]|nr:hypothetical protein [Alphaproteobacteria bacterium]